MDTVDPPASSFDEITAQLNALRAAVGGPSYTEIVRRVIALRTARGRSEWEARVGRTTVYDAFRPGRRSLDPDLVGDIVRALEGTEADARWLTERAAAVRGAAPAGAASRRPEPPAPAPPPVPAPAEPVLPGPPRRPAFPPRVRAAVLIACVALNLSGRLLVNVTHIPLYLDMVGTAIAAIIVGPWEGAGVGVLTSLAGVATNGWVSIPFAPVEIAGALLWGYGIRRWACGRTVPRFFLLNVAVGLCCSVVAVPIIVWVDHGVTGSGADQLTRTMHLFWHSLFAAVASQNLLTSLADKLLSGFAALAVVEAMPAGDVPDRPRLAPRSAWLQLRSAGARVR